MLNMENWRQEYEDTVTERNLLIQKVQRYEDIINKIIIIHNLWESNKLSCDEILTAFWNIGQNAKEIIR